VEGYKEEEEEEEEEEIENEEEKEEEKEEEETWALISGCFATIPLLSLALPEHKMPLLSLSLQSATRKVLNV